MKKIECNKDEVCHKSKRANWNPNEYITKMLRLHEEPAALELF